jgi:hypothetical protein
MAIWEYRKGQESQPLIQGSSGFVFKIIPYNMRVAESCIIKSFIACIFAKYN